MKDTLLHTSHLMPANSLAKCILCLSLKFYCSAFCPLFFLPSFLFFLFLFFIFSSFQSGEFRTVFFVVYFSAWQWKGT